MGSENRREPRAPIELRVEYRRMNTFFADYTKNISKGGTFIKTANPLPLGTRFLFILSVPGLPQPVQLEGVVTWGMGAEQAAQQNTDPGMGIRFLFDDDGKRRAFEESVEKLMIDTLGEDIYRQLVVPAASAS